MNDLDLTYDDIMIIRVSLHELINTCKDKIDIANETDCISTEDRMQLAQIADRAQKVYDKFETQSVEKESE